MIKCLRIFFSKIQGKKCNKRDQIHFFLYNPCIIRLLNCSPWCNGRLLRLSTLSK